MPFLASMAAGSIPWKLIGAAVLCLALAGAVATCSHQSDMRAAAEAQRDVAIQTANNNAAIAEKQSKARERLLEIGVKHHNEKEAIRRTANANRRNILDAPASDDGPVAPVLGRQLDSLRRDKGVEGGGGDPSAETR